MSLADLDGKSVVTTTGSVYVTWTKSCLMGANLQQVASPADAVTALKNSRADAFMFDDAYLLGAEVDNPGLTLTGDKFLSVPWGSASAREMWPRRSGSTPPWRGYRRRRLLPNPEGHCPCLRAAELRQPGTEAGKHASLSGRHRPGHQLQILMANEVDPDFGYDKH